MSSRAVHSVGFSNGGLLAGWLNAGGNNLTERLSKIEQPPDMAEELYLSVLTRRPTAEEQAEVAAYWEAGKADRFDGRHVPAWEEIVAGLYRPER